MDTKNSVLLTDLLTEAVSECGSPVPKPYEIDQVEYLELLLDNICDAIVVWSPEGKITYWNAAAESLFYAKKESRLGTSVDGVFLSQLAYPEPDRKLNVKENFQQEILFTRKDGEQVWINAQFIPLSHHTSPNTPVGTMCVSRDLSVCRQDQEKAQVTQSERITSLGDLASSVAHQISNPLTTIIADAQLLARDFGTNQQNKASAEAIIQAGWRAQAVVSELMKYSQLSHPVNRVIDVNQTIQSALLITTAYLQTIDIRLTIALGNDLPELIANPHQLTDLWVTLLLLARSAIHDKNQHHIQILSRKGEDQTIEVLLIDDCGSTSSNQYEQVNKPKYTLNASNQGPDLKMGSCFDIARRNNGKMVITTTGTTTTVHVTFNNPIEP